MLQCLQKASDTVQVEASEKEETSQDAETKVLPEVMKKTELPALPVSAQKQPANKQGGLAAALNLEATRMTKFSNSASPTSPAVIGATKAAEPTPAVVVPPVVVAPIVVAPKVIASQPVAAAPEQVKPKRKLMLKNQSLKSPVAL